MRRILVTGANKGIGLAIASRLLEEWSDTVVVVGSRDRGRGEAALQQLLARLGWQYKNRVELLQLDVTSDASVEAAVASLRALYGERCLYGLINNAGGSCEAARDTVELNCRAARRVTEALLPLLQPSGGRVVMVSSGAAPGFVSKCSRDKQEFMLDPNITWSELEQSVIAPFLRICEDSALDETGRKVALSRAGLGESAYGLSKACMNSYTIELARRLPDLDVNACSPGFIATDLTLSFTKGRDPASVGAKPVEAGTVAPIFL